MLIGQSAACSSLHTSTKTLYVERSTVTNYIPILYIGVGCLWFILWSLSRWSRWWDKWWSRGERRTCRGPGCRTPPPPRADLQHYTGCNLITNTLRPPSILPKLQIVFQTILIFNEPPFSFNFFLAAKNECSLQVAGDTVSIHGGYP